MKRSDQEKGHKDDNVLASPILQQTLDQDNRPKIDYHGFDPGWTWFCSRYWESIDIHARSCDIKEPDLNITAYKMFNVSTEEFHKGLEVVEHQCDYISCFVQFLLHCSKCGCTITSPSFRHPDRIFTFLNRHKIQLLDFTNPLRNLEIRKNNCLFEGYQEFLYCATNVASEIGIILGNYLWSFQLVEDIETWIRIGYRGPFSRVNNEARRIDAFRTLPCPPFGMTETKSDIILGPLCLDDIGDPTNYYPFFDVPLTVSETVAIDLITITNAHNIMEDNPRLIERILVSLSGKKPDIPKTTDPCAANKNSLWTERISRKKEGVYIGNVLILSGLSPYAKVHIRHIYRNKTHVEMNIISYDE